MTRRLGKQKPTNMTKRKEKRKKTRFEKSESSSFKTSSVVRGALVSHFPESNGRRREAKEQQREGKDQNQEKNNMKSFLFYSVLRKHLFRFWQNNISLLVSRSLPSSSSTSSSIYSGIISDCRDDSQPFLLRDALEKSTNHCRMNKD